MLVSWRVYNPHFQGSFRDGAMPRLGGFSFGAILAMEVARWGSPGCRGMEVDDDK